MAESSLPPPPTNSNGLLIGFGLVALLLVGGLVLWLVSATDEAASKEPPPATAPSVALSLERAGEVPAPPPPPPPPPLGDGMDPGSEQPTSEPTEVAVGSNVGEGLHGGKERSASARPVSTPNAPATPNTDGCAGSCPNRVDAALNQALRQRGASARNCYNAALRSNPTLQGKVGIKVRISPNGSACSASITSDTLGDPSVTSCILQKFKGGGYPKPNGGCADFEVPLSFVASGN